MKKNKLKTILALSITFLSSIAMANEKGNGGEAVVCFGAVDPVTHLAPVISAKLMDYVEALRYIPSLRGPDRNSYIQEALKRLKRVDAYRVSKIEDKLKEIANPQLALFLDRARDGIVIKKLNDAHHLFEAAEAGCEVVNVAMNLTNPDPSEFKYYFIQDYFDKLSPRDQAGLFLHEALYNLEASWLAKDSDGVRKQIQLMSSDDITHMTAQGYYSTLKYFSKKPTVTAINGDFSEYIGDLSFGSDPNLVLEGWLLSDQVYANVAGLDPVTSKFHIVPLKVKAHANSVAEFSGDSTLYGIAIGFEYRGPFYTFESFDFRSYFVSNGNGTGYFNGISIKLDGMSGPTSDDIRARDLELESVGNNEELFGQILNRFHALENYSQPLDIQYPAMTLPASVTFAKNESSGKVTLKSGKTFEWSSAHTEFDGFGDLSRALIFNGANGNLKEFDATPIGTSRTVDLKGSDGRIVSQLLKTRYGLSGGGRTKLLKADIDEAGVVTSISISARSQD
jgi:hypothetical protein